MVKFIIYNTTMDFIKKGLLMYLKTSLEMCALKIKSIII